MKRHLTRIIFLGIEQVCAGRLWDRTPTGELQVGERLRVVTAPDNITISGPTLQYLDQDRGLGSDNSSSPARVGHATRKPWLYIAART